MEPRLGWLRRHVCVALGVEAEAWDALLRVEDGVNAQRLLDWMDGSGSRPAIVFQATTLVVEAVRRAGAPPPFAHGRSSRNAGHFPATLDEGEEEFEVNDGAPAADVSTTAAPGAADAADGSLAAPAAAADAPPVEGAPLADGPASEPTGEEHEGEVGEHEAHKPAPPPPEPTFVATLHLAIGAGVQLALAERPDAAGIYFALLTDEPLALEGVEDVETFMVCARARTARRAPRSRACAWLMAIERLTAIEPPRRALARRAPRSSTTYRSARSRAVSRRSSPSSGCFSSSTCRSSRSPSRTRRAAQSSRTRRRSAPTAPTWRTSTL